jgi:hypothetical protein
MRVKDRIWARVRRLTFFNRSIIWLLELIVVVTVNSSLQALAASPARTDQKPREQPPLVLYPACPCYLAIGEGKGDTRIDARINLENSQRAGARFVVELADTAGKTIESESVDVSTNLLTGLSLHVPNAAPTTFQVTARLVDNSGKEMAKAVTDIHAGARKAPVVEVGSDGYLRIAGKAHFPIGMYNSGHLDEMGKAGFSVTHNYGVTTGDASELINPNDSHLKQLLDNAMVNGMRMMVELPRKAIEKAQWQQVRRRIETFRYHPGLLCWGSEERVARGLTPLTNIIALYQLVHELDPNHPLVLGDTKDVIKKFQHDRRDFFPDSALDIGIWWWYPIPLKDPDGNGLASTEKTGALLTPPSWLTTTVSKKPLWIAIQAYQHPTKDGRFPTPAEYRCMAYLSIIHGVKGLFFYTGSGQKDFEGKPAGLLNKMDLAHWDYVQKLARELREISAVITAPSGAAKVALTPTDAPIEYCCRQFKDKFYLFTANKSGRAQTVHFTGDILNAKKADVLFEGHSLVVSGNSLTDEFQAFDVHLYEIPH